MRTIETGKEQRDKLEMDIYQPFVHTTNWHGKVQLGQSKFTGNEKIGYSPNLQEMKKWTITNQKDINGKTITLDGY